MVLSAIDNPNFNLDPKEVEKGSILDVLHSLVQGSFPSEEELRGFSKQNIIQAYEIAWGVFENRVNRAKTPKEKEEEIIGLLATYYKVKDLFVSLNQKNKVDMLTNKLNSFRIASVVSMI